MKNLIKEDIAYESQALKEDLKTFIGEESKKNDKKVN